MFTFTSLLGAQSSSNATQSILELDGGAKILVDVGWDESFDPRQLNELERHLPTVSFILLTHATTSHIGAFVHCCKHFPIFTQIPVYATTPVIAFGRTLLQDLYSSHPLAATFITPTGSETEVGSLITVENSRSTILAQGPTTEEIAKYFSLITPLKYSQPYQPSASAFSPPLEGLTLTAFNSGHTVGGTIWLIQHGMESIIYAVDWNQVRENVVGGAAWFGGIGGSEVIEQLRKPTALVCSSKGADKVALSGGRKKRDELLLDNIRSSLVKGGTVLIPTDSSARVLELAWLLEKAWQEGAGDMTLRSAKVYLASKSAIATMRHARSLLEWMDDSIVREFEGDEGPAARTHKRTGSKQTNGQTAKSTRPFDFGYVKMIERKSQLEKILKGEGPRVILASDLSLEWGFSNLAVQDVLQKAENLVILSEKINPKFGSKSSSYETLGQTLWRWFEERQDGVAIEKALDGSQLEQVHSGGRTLNIRHISKAPLDTNEAQIYQQYMVTREQLQNSFSRKDDAGISGPVDAADDDSDSSSSDESDDEHQGKVLNVSAAIGHAGRKKVALSDEDLGVSILLRKRGVYDFDVRNKKGRNAIFPYVHNRKRADEFGEYIRPEDYLRAEEKEETDGVTDSGQGAFAGQKRKWNDLRNAMAGGASKRQNVMGEEGTDGQDRIAGSDDIDGADDSDDSDAGSVVQSPEGPFKASFTSTTINVNARLAHVDFTGIHDQRSLQMLIPLIGPRKLILIGGTDKETASLASNCKDLLAIKDAETESATEIFTPETLQTVDASVDTNAWIVKLSRNLVKRLQWQNVRNMSVVTLAGQLKGQEPPSEKTGGENSRKRQKLIKNETEKEDTKAAEIDEQPKEVDPILDVVPTTMVTASRSGNQPLHVGDMRLADLRRLMGMAGHSAEFRGEGTLLVDGNIAVRKLGTGKIVVEGMPVNVMATPSSDRRSNFEVVKRHIYEGLAVVAGI